MTPITNADHDDQNGQVDDTQQDQQHEEPSMKKEEDQETIDHVTTATTTTPGSTDSVARNDNARSTTHHHENEDTPKPMEEEEEAATKTVEEEEMNHQSTSTNLIGQSTTNAVEAVKDETENDEKNERESGNPQSNEDMDFDAAEKFDKQSTRDVALVVNDGDGERKTSQAVNSSLSPNMSSISINAEEVNGSALSKQAAAETSSDMEIDETVGAATITNVTTNDAKNTTVQQNDGNGDDKIQPSANKTTTTKDGDSVAIEKEIGSDSQPEMPERQTTSSQKRRGRTSNQQKKLTTKRATRGVTEKEDADSDNHPADDENDDDDGDDEAPGKNRRHSSRMRSQTKPYTDNDPCCFTFSTALEKRRARERQLREQEEKRQKRRLAQQEKKREQQLQQEQKQQQRKQKQKQLATTTPQKQQQQKKQQQPQQLVKQKKQKQKQKEVVVLTQQSTRQQKNENVSKQQKISKHASKTKTKIQDEKNNKAKKQIGKLVKKDAVDEGNHKNDDHSLSHAMEESWCSSSTSQSTSSASSTSSSASSSSSSSCSVASIKHMKHENDEKSNHGHEGIIASFHNDDRHKKPPKEIKIKTKQLRKPRSSPRKTQQAPVKTGVVEVGGGDEEDKNPIVAIPPPRASSSAVVRTRNTSESETAITKEVLKIEEGLCDMQVTSVGKTDDAKATATKTGKIEQHIKKDDGIVVKLEEEKQKAVTCKSGSDEEASFDVGACSLCHCALDFSDRAAFFEPDRMEDYRQTNDDSSKNTNNSKKGSSNCSVAAADTDDKNKQEREKGKKLDEENIKGAEADSAELVVNKQEKEKKLDGDTVKEEEDDSGTLEVVETKSENIAEEKKEFDKKIDERNDDDDGNGAQVIETKEGNIAKGKKELEKKIEQNNDDDDDFFFRKNDPYLPSIPFYNPNNALVYCDSCPRMFHQHCHFVPILTLPARGKPWHCLVCTVQKEQKKKKKKKNKKQKSEGKDEHSADQEDRMFLSPPDPSARALEKQWEIDNADAKARSLKATLDQLQRFVRGQLQRHRQAMATLDTLTTTRRNLNYFIKNTARNRNSQELAQTLVALFGSRLRLRQTLGGLHRYREQGEGGFTMFRKLLEWTENYLTNGDDEDEKKIDLDGSTNHTDKEEFVKRVLFPFGTQGKVERRIVPRTPEMMLEYNSNNNNTNATKDVGSDDIPATRPVTAVPEVVTTSTPSTDKKASSKKANKDKANKGNSKTGCKDNKHEKSKKCKEVDKDKKKSTTDKDNKKRKEHKKESSDENNDNVSLDDLQCCVCLESTATDDNDLVLCDGAHCFRAYHVRCIHPHAEIDEEEDWFCPLCTSLAELLMLVQHEVMGEEWERARLERKQRLEKKKAAAMKKKKGKRGKQKVIEEDMNIDGEDDDDDDSSLASWNGVEDVFPQARWQYDSACLLLKGIRNGDTGKLLKQVLGEDDDDTDGGSSEGEDKDDEQFDLTQFEEEKRKQRQSQTDDGSDDGDDDDDESTRSSQATLVEMSDVEFNVANELDVLSTDDEDDDSVGRNGLGASTAVGDDDDAPEAAARTRRSRRLQKRGGDEQVNKIRSTDKSGDEEDDEEGGISKSCDPGKLDPKNILNQKRNRKRVDYRKLNDSLFGDLDDKEIKNLDGGADYRISKPKQSKAKMNKSDDGSGNEDKEICNEADGDNKSTGKSEQGEEMQEEEMQEESKSKKRKSSIDVDEFGTNGGGADGEKEDSSEIDKVQKEEEQPKRKKMKPSEGDEEENPCSQGEDEKERTDDKSAKEYVDEGSSDHRENDNDDDCKMEKEDSSETADKEQKEEEQSKRKKMEPSGEGDEEENPCSQVEDEKERTEDKSVKENADEGSSDHHENNNDDDSKVEKDSSETTDKEQKEEEQSKRKKMDPSGEGDEEENLCSQTEDEKEITEDDSVKENVDGGSSDHIENKNDDDSKTTSSVGAKKKNSAKRKASIDGTGAAPKKQHKAGSQEGHEDSSEKSEKWKSPKDESTPTTVKRRGRPKKGSESNKAMTNEKSDKKSMTSTPEKACKTNTSPEKKTPQTSNETPAKRRGRPPKKKKNVDQPDNDATNRKSRRLSREGSPPSLSEKACTPAEDKDTVLDSITIQKSKTFSDNAGDTNINDTENPVHDKREPKNTEYNDGSIKDVLARPTGSKVKLNQDENAINTCNNESGYLMEPLSSETNETSGKDNSPSLQKEIEKETTEELDTRTSSSTKCENEKIDNSGQAEKSNKKTTASSSANLREDTESPVSATKAPPLTLEDEIDSYKNKSNNAPTDPAKDDSKCIHEQENDCPGIRRKLDLT